MAKSISKIQTLTHLCQLSAAIERRGKSIWKIAELAEELGWITAPPAAISMTCASLA